MRESCFGLFEIRNAIEFGCPRACWSWVFCTALLPFTTAAMEDHGCTLCLLVPTVDLRRLGLADDSLTVLFEKPGGPGAGGAGS
ncbi:MAG: hypothetical protein ACLSAF_20395 [Intestinimonas sp.]